MKLNESRAFAATGFVKLADLTSIGSRLSATPCDANLQQKYKKHRNFKYNNFMRVYYFTSSEFAISNIALRRVKISRFHDLNDPFELLGVNLGDKALRSKFRKMKEDINNKSGLICFSKSWKNPLLWGHYAEKHTGIALGFDIPDNKMMPVIYDSKLIDVTFDKKTGKPSPGITDKLVRTKFKDWKYEKEVRLFVTLDDDRKESGYYFEPFHSELQLREVILGPRCELQISAIRNLVKDFSPAVEVIKSRIAFTRFEVLENKAASKIDQKKV